MDAVYGVADWIIGSFSKNDYSLTKEDFRKFYMFVSTHEGVLNNEDNMKLDFYEADSGANYSCEDICCYEEECCTINPYELVNWIINKCGLKEGFTLHYPVPADCGCDTYICGPP